MKFAALLRYIRQKQKLSIAEKYQVELVLYRLHITHGKETNSSQM